MKEITLTVSDEQYNAMCSVYRNDFNNACDDFMRGTIADLCGCASVDDVTDDQLVMHYAEVYLLDRPSYVLYCLKKKYDLDLSEEERVLYSKSSLIHDYCSRIDMLCVDDCDADDCLEDGLDDGGLYYSADGKVFIACDKTFEPEPLKKDLGMSYDPEDPFG